MKKYILLVLLILSIIPIMFVLHHRYSSCIYKILDFSNEKSEPEANKILYEYVLKTQNKTPEEIKNFARITPESVRAFEFDLNNDGTNEIVGVVYSTLYLGTAGYNLFILQKQPDGYKDISFSNFEPEAGVTIRKEKTNGYHDIKLTGYHGDIQFVIKYKDGMYDWAYKL